MEAGQSSSPWLLLVTPGFIWGKGRVCRQQQSLSSERRLCSVYWSPADFKHCVRAQVQRLQGRRRHMDFRGNTWLPQLFGQTDRREELLNSHWRDLDCRCHWETWCSCLKAQAKKNQTRKAIPPTEVQSAVRSSEQELTFLMTCDRKWKYRFYIVKATVLRTSALISPNTSLPFGLY